MKKFFKGLIEIKTSTCQLFTAAITIYLFFSLIFQNREVPAVLLWSLLLVSAAGALLQALCFSDWIIKKMRYTWRSLLFVLSFFPALTFAAIKAEWFPVDKTGAWAMFIGIFFLIFLSMTIGFDIYFRITGRKYDGLIGQYRKGKEAEENSNPPNR